jgi:hypothetical protein
MSYEGFGALCAAYAFLNTTGFPKISPETYELLSGVPFGIKHIVGDSHRMLTPFVEPCHRIGSTASLLGYSTTLSQFSDIVGATTYIAQFPIESRVMLGPVDMGYLTHLPQNLYYCGESHYFSIVVWSRECFIAVDSEGTLSYKYDKKTLTSVLNSDRISESNGLLNVWKFNRVNDYLQQKDYRSIILRLAISNMNSAEDSGNGSQSFIACYNDLKDVNPIEWSLKLYYELNFLIQRKLLFSVQLRKWCLVSAKNILMEQIKTLCELREDALQKQTPNKKLYEQVAYHERALLQIFAGLKKKERL